MATTVIDDSREIARDDSRSQGWVLAALVAILLGGLPIAVWLDLRNLSEELLHRQASDMN